MVHFFFFVGFIAIVFFRQLDHLACYRAGGLVSALDLFMMFVAFEVLDVSITITILLTWVKKVSGAVKIEIHPITIFLLTRIYYICGKSFSLTGSQTTRIIKYRKVHFFCFFFLGVFFSFIYFAFCS